MKHYLIGLLTILGGLAALALVCYLLITLIDPIAVIPVVPFLIITIGLKDEIIKLGKLIAGDS